MNITNRVRVIRESKGLKVVELAREIGISHGDLSKLERGERRAYPNWRKRISEALEVPEAELFPSAIEEAEQPR